MNPDGEKFLQELEKEIGNHPNKQDIIAEYKGHVYELLQEVSDEEKLLYDELISRLGTPQEIAKLWKQESGVTPKKVQWLFVVSNIIIFVGGSLLTIVYNFYNWSWIENIWNMLTQVPTILFIVYILFWALLGYEIGKEFGYKGYRILQKTFLLSIIPNLVLMYLVIFKILPHEWFQPLLNIPFIVMCVLFTAILYPISLLGYYWGKKVSV
ncbi:hypothetical protein AB4Y30_01810 [Ornithinibacillus sp. 4-3]|uniref:DUF1700 domain-containing protein n=1 Tax=Ornithinibacillus sp. 4-3 TaxID=3231488 RepID=A0AB39HR54_9BACI